MLERQLQTYTLKSLARWHRCRCSGEAFARSVVATVWADNSEQARKIALACMDGGIDAVMHGFLEGKHFKNALELGVAVYSLKIPPLVTSTWFYVSEAET